VLEVKDWRLESIVSADKINVELLTSRGIVRESSPLAQARRYTFEVVLSPIAQSADPGRPVDITNNRHHRPTPLAFFGPEAGISRAAAEPSARACAR